MNISCSIIQDLLPLYAEELASPDSQTLVSEHLCGCDACAAEYAMLKKSISIPIETDSAPLLKLRRAISHRRMLSVLTAVLSILTLGAMALSFFTAGILLPAEEAIDNIYVREDGALVIDYAEHHVGIGTTWIGGNNRMILCYSTRFDRYQSRHRPSVQETFGSDGIVTQEEWDRYNNIHVTYGTWKRYEDGRHLPYDPETCLEGEGEITDWAADYNYWYPNVYTGKPQTHLHSSETATEIEDLYWNAEYAWFLAMFTLITPVFAFLGKKVRSKRKKEILTSLSIACGCTAFSILYVSGGRVFSVWCGATDARWLSYIIAISCLLTATTILLRKLFRIKQQDKNT